METSVDSENGLSEQVCGFSVTLEVNLFAAFVCGADVTLIKDDKKFPHSITFFWLFDWL